MIGKKVPGHGNLASKIVLVGEGPGKTEALTGIPFCGASGSELDHLYLRRAAGIEREDIYVTSIVKYRTDEDDSDPTQDDIERDQDELIAEIQVINPEIIVAVGKVAANWFLQTDDADLERYHGLPVSCPRFPDKILFVTYHPAAGLHQPERYLHLIYYDFQQLGRLVRGEIGKLKPKYDPQITLLEAPEACFVGNPVYVDTEGSIEVPWGMSFAVDPVQGYVVPHGSVNLANRTVGGHNLLHDVSVLSSLGQEIDLADTEDSMLMAYQFPYISNKLKILMFKLAGMEQDTYELTMGPANELVGNRYFSQVLEKVCRTCKGECEVDEPYKRNPNKFKRVKCSSCAGDGTGWPQPTPKLLFDSSMSGRVYKPRSIGRSIRAALERGNDLRACWESINDEVRLNVEGELGSFPEATLDDIPLEKAVHYSGMDAVGTAAVSIELKKMLKQDNLERIYEIDKSILPIIHKMHTNGILIDKEYFARLANDFGREQLNIMDELCSLSGGDINPSSPLQVAVLLYDKFRLKAPRNSRSTDDKTMQALKIKYRTDETANRCIDLINDYRELGKLIGTYVEPLPKAADSNNRVHTKFLLHVTTSGRLSSRDPNLQNQPTRSEKGKLIRGGFIARPGFSLVSVDLDQIELRVTAHLSEDENMIDVFTSGKDIHRATASLVYGKVEDEITAQERLLSKTMNFLILYGGGPSKLNKELSLMGINTSIDECVGYINDWFKAYPSVRQYMDRCYAQAKSLGYVECLFGRRRYLPGVHSTIEKIREESKRWATNHPAQGTAAALLKLWMADVDKNVLPRFGNDVYTLLTVHDELIFECIKGREQELIDAVVKSANNIVDFLVPIGAKGNFGQTWAELK